MFLKSAEDSGQFEDDLEKDCVYGGVWSYNLLKERVDSWKDDQKEPEAIEYLKNYVINGFFNFCSCGLHGRTEKTINDILQCFTSQGLDDPRKAFCDPMLSLCYSGDEFRKRFGDNDILEDFLLKWLDSIGYTEHGTSIYGSWIKYEDFPRAVREALRRWSEYVDKGMIIDE